MHRTLLLCFIHGFKGGDDTFVGFPEHLRALVSHALPNITVKAVTYPKFETRGDLRECVGRFREWLQNKVIDLEVAASTPSPTVDPSVHTILIGHSMGGIVAAETLLAIASDPPISSQKDPLPSMASQTVPGTQPPSTDSEGHTLMFPYIQGILAFDTPYLGISPGVVAHGAEQHYKTVSGAYSALSDVAGVLGYGTSKKDASPKKQQDNQKLLTQGADAMSASMTNASSDAAAVPAWQRWGKYAMFAGAAGAVAAGGAAAYLKRDTITEGWSFIGSHLEFVGCLARGEELRSRLERIVILSKNRNIGFADIITVLGKSAVGDRKPGTTVPNTGGFVEIGSVDGIAPSERTFCTVPKSDKHRRFFEKAKNDKATDEMQAHMSMFTPKENSGYFILGERARDLIVQWMDPEANEWYRESQSGDEMKKVMMDIDLGGDETESNPPWAGDEPIPQPLRRQGERDQSPPSLPRKVDDDNKLPTLARRKEGPATVATAVGQKDENARAAATPSKLRVRPPKLGPSKGKLELAKANEEKRSGVIATPVATPPATPRGRPRKSEGPIPALRLTQPTQTDQKPLTALSDGPRLAKLPKIAQAAADMESNEDKDRVSTSGGLTRKPPKLGRPKAGKVGTVRIPKSVEVKPSASETRDDGVEAERSAPDFELEGAKAEKSTVASISKSDERKISAKVLGPTRAQASNVTPVSEEIKTETSEELDFESNSANVQVSEAASNHDQALEATTEKAGAATAEDQVYGPPNLEHSKAEPVFQEHSDKPGTLIPRREPGSVKADTSKKPAMISASPETKVEATGAIPESPHPRRRAPKLGRPKAKVKLQKQSTQKDVRAVTPGPSSPTTETSPRASNVNEAPEAGMEKANVAEQGVLRPKPKPPKIGRPKAELAVKEAEKLPKNESNLTFEKPYTASSQLRKIRAEHDCATADPRQSNESKG